MSSTAPPPAGPRTSVVIGGSLAGMLTAAALAEFGDVVVVERDALPDGPRPRRGLPQAHHAHLLWSGGAAAIDSLLPGTIGRLMDDGAHRIALPTNMVGFSPEGWFRRWAEASHYVVIASRDLLDWHVRRAVGALSRVTVVDRTEVLGLEGDARRVTGVRVRERGGEERVVEADLVVDASGRSSHTPDWLAGFGMPRPAVRTVDPGLVYASRIFRAPKDLGSTFPVIVNIQADPRDPVPGRSATLVPIEGDRWLITLSGTRGGEPTKDPEAFEGFARDLRHPIVSELIAQTEPLTDVVVTRTTVNRRHHYEKAAMPRGLAVIGDAVAAYNPVYGHGMSVAAQSALALRAAVARYGWSQDRLGARVQKAVSRPGERGVGAVHRHRRLLPGRHRERPDAGREGGGGLRTAAAAHQHRQRAGGAGGHRRDDPGAARRPALHPAGAAGGGPGPAPRPAVRAAAGGRGTGGDSGAARLGSAPRARWGRSCLLRRACGQFLQYGDGLGGPVGGHEQVVVVVAA